VGHTQEEAPRFADNMIDDDGRQARSDNQGECGHPADCRLAATPIRWTGLKPTHSASAGSGIAVGGTKSDFRGRDAIDQEKSHERSIGARR
jgi:hypothetical protein